MHVDYVCTYSDMNCHGYIQPGTNGQDAVLPAFILILYYFISKRPAQSTLRR